MARHAKGMAGIIHPDEFDLGGAEIGAQNHEPSFSLSFYELSIRIRFRHRPRLDISNRDRLAFAEHSYPHTGFELGVALFGGAFMRPNAPQDGCGEAPGLCGMRD